MKLKLFLIAASAMTLASCSSDEVVKNNEDANAITFSVTANNASRSADYWCNSKKPTYFEVSARYDGKTYFDGDVFKDNSGIYKQNDEIYRYWPDLSVKAMSIWAYKVKADEGSGIASTGFATFKLNEGAPTIAMKPEANAVDQRDLIYAYTSVTEKPALGKQVALNFRHALSQVVFYAKNENKKIDVKIQQIQIVNVAKGGVFSLPNGTSYTTENVDIHKSPADTQANSNGLGTWALDKKGEATDWTRATYTAVSKDQNSLTSDLKNLTDQTHENGGQALLLIPQTKYTGDGAADNSTTAWVPFTESEGTKTYKLAKEEKKNSFILVYCKIQNISKGTSATGDDVYLVGSNESWGKIAIPASFAWEQGKKYIYNINFTTTGHGGFDPDKGTEVLVPIEFTVTVDDFASDETFNFNGNNAF